MTDVVIQLEGRDIILRPTFAALVSAEAELGPLFFLVERAASGQLGIGETVALFWHCLKDRPETLTREQLGEALTKLGLSAMTPPLRALLATILRGDQ